MSDLRRTIQLLSVTPLFAQTQVCEVERLAAVTRMVHVERKKLIFSPGDECKGFYIVVYGRVKLALTSTAHSEKPLQFVGPGGSFGDITMFLERPFYLTAQALEDSLLAFVPRQGILDLITHDPRFAMRMLASLSLRLRNMVDDIESFSLQPPAARVITYLMRLLPPDCVAPAKIELTINKNVVAAHLNLTPETLSRCFRELTVRGLVTLEGKTVLVHDIDQLGTYMAGLNRIK